MHFIMIYVLPFLVVITLLVFVHELGHYYFAIKYGVKVEEFSIGMGPELFGFNDKNGTRWKFSAIPFGGYVMMHGDKDAASTPSEDELKKMAKDDFNKTLFSKTPLRRVMISFAGPMANIIYAMLIFIAVYVFAGKPFSTNIVQEVSKSYPAASADIRSGDIILNVDGTKIDKGSDLVKILSTKNPDDHIQVSRLRGDSIETIDIKLDKKRALGVSFNIAYEKFGFFESLYKALADCLITFFAVLAAFIKLLTGGAALSSVGGPLSIASMLGNIATNGDITYLLFFSAILSINLGALNLFPLPALDGGNLIFDLLEHFGVKIRMDYREKITGCFFILLILFMIFATLNDVMKIEFVKSLFK